MKRSANGEANEGLLRRSKQQSSKGGGQGFSPEQKQRNDQWADRLTPRQVVKGTGCAYTVTLAVPGSLVRLAPTRELKTSIVGQIARAAVIHEVDEIVVFVDSAAEAAAPDPDKTPSVFCCRILQYLECPSYLRRNLFPHHPDLSSVGLLPTLDTPHHMRMSDNSMYREGATTSTVEGGCMVNAGLSTEIFLPRPIKPGVRVTVKFDEEQRAVAVKPTEPREKYGLYWGYTVRLAKTFADVFSGSPYPGGYDFLVGNGMDKAPSISSETTALKKNFKHLLVVFGSHGGIESCVEADETLSIKGRDTATLFDLWVNLSPSNGCKQVRTEEALMIGLSRLTPLIQRAQK
jgi:methyltransferase